MNKRKALGKGLSALIPDAVELDSQEVAFFHCPVDAIEPNPYQPRQDFSDPELAEMVASVKEKGVLTPLLVTRTETGYCLIAGERRWRAACKAGLSTVPVVIKDVSPAEALELALIENIHRRDLNAIEEARAYQRLLEEYDMTQDALAARLGKDRSSVANYLRLLNLPLSIQQDLIDGKLTMGHARVLAGIKDPAFQQALRDAAVRRSLSVRQLEAMAKKPMAEATPEPPSERQTYFDHLQETLKRNLGTKVEIRDQGKKGGRIILHYFSDGELDRLLEVLS